MRIKVRITTAALQQKQEPAADPKTEHNMDSLSRLFPTDPVVAFDENGWYLSATRIDQTDDDQVAGVPERLVAIEATRILNEMNGVARLLRVAHGVTVEPAYATGVYEGQRSGAVIRLGGLQAYSHQIDHLEESSAMALLRLAESEPPVQRTLQLFARPHSEWFWFDMYRIYEQIVGYFAADKKTFESWVDALQPGWDRARVEFEDSANNPNLGADRRHGKRNYVRRVYPGTNQPVQAMTRTDATLFLKKLVVHWIDHEYGVTLDPQFNQFN